MSNAYITPMVDVARAKFPKEAWLIADRLKRQLHADAVYLFGSHARGEAGPDSDLDIAVVVPQACESRYRRSVAARVLVGDVFFPKDIVVLTRDEWERERGVTCSLADTIQREGVRLDLV
jgi:predicted nucleotidyltransferase